MAGGRRGVRAEPAALSALDQIEIQQLVWKYAYALDTGADNGYAYADLFTATPPSPA